MGFPKSAKAAAQRVVFRGGATLTRATMNGVAAEVVLDELNRIHNKGDLTAKSVVSASRPDEAPLHPVFEWDDTVAGERFREHQATNLIRCVRIERPVVDENSTTTEVEITIQEPAFVNVSPTGQQGVYKRPAEVAKNVSYLAIATENAVRRLDEANRALEDLRKIAEDAGDDRSVLVVAALSSLEVAREAVAKFN
jgi:hypothetical protein